MNENDAREKIEEMQRLNSLKPKRSAMAEQTPEQQLQDFKRKYEKLKTIIINSLVALDLTLKIGLPLGLFFWPIPKDNWIQAIGLGVYIILLTIISKTITKVKGQQ